MLSCEGRELSLVLHIYFSLTETKSYGDGYLDFKILVFGSFSVPAFRDILRTKAYLAGKSWCLCLVLLEAVWMSPVRSLASFSSSRRECRSVRRAIMYYIGTTCNQHDNDGSGDGNGKRCYRYSMLSMKTDCSPAEKTLITDRSTNQNREQEPKKI